MKVTLVTTFGIPCGIAEDSAYLKAELERQGITVEVETNLHPDAILTRQKWPPVVLLNYGAAIHSQWHVKHIHALQEVGTKILVVWHDSGVPNSDHCKDICEAADWFVLHEPFDDLPAHGTYIRHGVPEWQDDFYFWQLRQQMVREGLWWRDQPVVGTVGLTLGYRNYDLLCEAAARVGWGTLLIASQATDEDEARWKALNPATVVLRTFLPREHLVSYLAGCNATAQLTVTNNAAQSAAISQCLAARKPVIAFRSRYFRGLEAGGAEAIHWIEGSTLEVAVALRSLPVGIDYGIVAIAARDSWRNVGKVFADKIRELLA